MLTPSVTSSAPHAAKRTSQADLGKKDIFLKLLVAQMQYQNPLKPQDPTQMSAQLAQFNMVDQQTKSNKLLEQLVNAGGSSASQPLSGAGYLGHTVTIKQNDIFYNGGNQQFSAVLDGPAAQAVVSILDSNGKPVRTINLNNLAAGANPITWDGKTDTGTTAPQGRYSIQISASNLNGGTVGSAIQRSGIVDAVRFTASGTQLMVGGIPAPITDITEIRL